MNSRGRAAVPALWPVAVIREDGGTSPTPALLPCPYPRDAAQRSGAAARSQEALSTWRRPGPAHATPLSLPSPPSPRHAQRQQTCTTGRGNSAAAEIQSKALAGSQKRELPAFSNDFRAGRGKNDAPCSAPRGLSPLGSDVVRCAVLRGAAPLRADSLAVPGGAALAGGAGSGGRCRYAPREGGEGSVQGVVIDRKTVHSGRQVNAARRAATPRPGAAASPTPRFRLRFRPLPSAPVFSPSSPPSCGRAEAASALRQHFLARLSPLYHLPLPPPSPLLLYSLPSRLPARAPHPLEIRSPFPSPRNKFPLPAFRFGWP